MRGILSLVVVLLLAGCAGAGPTPSKSGGPGGTGGPTASTVPTTVDGVLRNQPHLTVAGPTTIQWDFDNATGDAPESVATLIYFGSELESGLHEMDDGIFFVGFLPVNATDQGGCNALPGGLHYFFRGSQGGGGGGGNNNDDDFQNLTGKYASGWYHAVLVATGQGSFSISFDTSDEWRPRKIPAADPYATPFYEAKTGERTVTLDVPTGGLGWFAFARHQIGAQGGGFGGGGSGIDGGRTHTVGFNGGCVEASRTSTNAFLNNQNVLFVGGYGSGGAAAEGVYSPSQPAIAPTATTLSVVAAVIKPVVVPAANATTEA